MIANPTPTKTGLILHLQRLSTEDGPGLRTTIFFKGCPLSCLWCHNPESINPKPQIQWLSRRCIGDHACISACPTGALSASDSGIQINRDLCTGCGICTTACPTNAMELLGVQFGEDKLFDELMKDFTFYRTSGGGVTASGGEPTLQSDFVGSLFTRLRNEGVNTALDTCGYCSKNTLTKLLSVSDMVLFDIKFLDDTLHRKYTGKSNTTILDNLIYIGDYLTNCRDKKSLWVRTPLIPGATASESNLMEIGRFIHAHIEDHLDRWELCAFNNLCRDKYERLDLKWNYADTQLLTQSEIGNLLDAAVHSGVDPRLIITTGATKVEPQH